VATEVSAQQPVTTTTETVQTTTVATSTTTDAPQEAAQAEEAAPADQPSNSTIRERFNHILHRHPPEVSRILRLDPTMVNNEPFLARYPEVADYIAKNPEIRRNPHYFIRGLYYDEPQIQRHPLESTLEGITIFLTVGLIAVALAWFVRTLIEQRRWNRLSRQQAEVHNKILDRFGTSNELLDYVKSEAGTKFLQSAPIPVRAERQVASTPMTRIMLTVQIGVVIAVAAVGFMVVGALFEKEGEGVFAMGVIAFSIGAGFIASAVVSLLMSKRLGLWRSGQNPDHDVNDPGLVR
jgi:hypothetical protein